jgi:hypothetical protein
VHRLDVLFEIGNLVKVSAAQIAALLAVGAHVGDRVEGNRGDRAVFFHADLVMLLRRPAAVHADVVVLPGKFKLHRLPADFGQHSGHVVVILRLVLVPEAAAHVFAHHSHPAERQTEILGDVGTRVGNALGRRENGQLARFPLSHAHPALQLGVVYMLSEIGVFEDPVGVFEALFDVAPGFFDRRAKVALAYRKIAARRDFRRVR